MTSTTTFCQHNQKPPWATKGSHRVDGVATKQRHTRVTPLHYNSIFSTNCGMDFILLRCGRLGKRILQLKRCGVGGGSWNDDSATFVAHEEPWESVSFERAGSFVSKRCQTMSKNKPSEPRRWEKMAWHKCKTQKQWHKNKGTKVCDFTEGIFLVA